MQYPVRTTYSCSLENPKLASALGINLISSIFMYSSMSILQRSHLAFIPSISYMTACCCLSVHFISFIKSLLDDSTVKINSPACTDRLHFSHFLLSPSAASPQNAFMRLGHRYGVLSLPLTITGTLILFPYNVASELSDKCTSIASLSSATLSSLSKGSMYLVALSRSA